MGNTCAGGEDGEDPGSFAPKSLKANLMREQKNRDVFKYYEVTKVLGEGSMGAVSAARKKESKIGGSAYKDCERRGIVSRFFGGKKSAFVDNASEHKKSYALKTIQLNRITDEFIEELRNEIDILRTLDHPNIVKAFEVFENKRQIYIVMESCDGGDLYARNPYSEKETAKIVGKVLSAVAYMHATNVCHRDLKFENIMFENKKKNAEIKVIDFGLSKKFISGKKMSEGVGTIYTMAPQVLQGVYTSQADLWSIGVIAYMLLSSSKPFYARKRRYMIDKIMRCDFKFHGPGWKHVSEEAKNFVSALIKLDPKKRLTAEQALDHKWLSTEFSLTDRRPPEEFMNDVHGNIISYHDTSEFKKMALMVIAHKSSTAEIVKLRQAFDQYDSSNDGTITLVEFKGALSEFNYTEEDVEQMFESVVCVR
uniref:Calmodulin n=1 Tax=Odontella aurita TaxID=265563 RepID=A0A7S4N7F1_9STRA|mmetsp:Transcript_50537/g.152268  ORF Transcript_50537/g.152268 Transcript_50537/m.152268 type:complete len:423 (+) Transcript_50537:169-1437(+)